MKIVFAADTYKPYISGVTIYMSQHMAALKRLGHEVRLVTFARKNDPHEKDVLSNPGVRTRVGYAMGFRYSKASLETLQSADIIHIHHPFLSGRLVLRAVRNYNIPLVCTVHTRYDEYLQDYFPWIPKKAGWKILAGSLNGFFNRMDGIICTSDAAIQGLRNLGLNHPVTRIANGIELAPFLAAQRDPSVRSELGGDGKTLFLYVGRLAHEKNLALLLEAFAQVIRKGCQAQLALVGIGPAEAELKHKAQQLGIGPHVTFTGQRPFESLPAFYASADFYVMPSVADTHPLAVIEAMAAGLGVLAVQSPAYADTVLPGENGFQVANNAAALAAALESLTSDAPLRQQMGQRSREISMRFSVEGSAQRLLDLYQSVRCGQQQAGGTR